MKKKMKSRGITRRIKKKIKKNKKMKMVLMKMKKMRKMYEYHIIIFESLKNVHCNFTLLESKGRLVET